MSDKVPAIIEIQDNDKLMTFQGLFKTPSLEMQKDRIEIPYLSLSTWVQGRTQWTNPKIELFDYYTKDFKFISDWIRSYTETLTGRHYIYSNDYKKTISVITTDGTWSLIGAQIVSCNLNVVYDFNDPAPLFPDILLTKLTRKILIEKKNNSIIQTFTEIELMIDNAKLMP